MPRRALVAAMLALLGCTPRADRIQLSDNESATQTEVLRRLPAGTSIAEARRVMEANGFACEAKKDRPFSAGGAVREHLDYLYCDVSRSAGTMVSRRWQIALVEKDGAVSEVLVSTGLIGP